MRATSGDEPDSLDLRDAVKGVFDDPWPVVPPEQWTHRPVATVTSETYKNYPFDTPAPDYLSYDQREIGVVADGKSDRSQEEMLSGAEAISIFLAKKGLGVAAIHQRAVCTALDKFPRRRV